jgi:hypothetical protein
MIVKPTGQQSMSQSQVIQQEPGEAIARRGAMRNAEARDRRVMHVLFGIMTFLGVMGFFGSLIEWAEGAMDPWMVAYGIGLCVLHVVAAWRLWFHDEMRFWVIGAPIVIPMLALATDVALGLASPDLPILQLAMLGLYLWRRRTLAAAKAARAETLQRSSEVPA